MQTIDPPPSTTTVAPEELRGPEFAAELRTVSELWFACGYAPGIAAYTTFFLLGAFVELHDQMRPARFADGRAMAKSFYATDLFIRAVTDSGCEATGGISSPQVQSMLRAIMRRHAAASIPAWSMTWFGWTLFEAVEARCAPLSDEQRRLHLGYMSKAWRLLGIPFSNDRAAMTAFARAVEAAHVGVASMSSRHLRAILRIGEMIGVPADPDAIERLLPLSVRAPFRELAAAARPGWFSARWHRLLGRLLLPRAVGVPRLAVPLPG